MMILNFYQMELIILNLKLIENVLTIMQMK